MKTIGIVTINSYNLGNRLQNFALQEVLKKCGYKPITIVREQRRLELKDIIKRKICSLRGRSKYDNFCKFDSRISWSKFSIEELIADPLKIQYFDYFVAGSDQVWNVTFPFVSDIDFLSFAPNEKKISYAASFGISDVPDDYKEMVSKNLLGFKAISVREKIGVDIVSNLIRRNAQLVLDPTLLLKESEWSKIERRPHGLTTDDYIFSYFLGANNNLEYICQLGKCLGADIIENCIFDKRFSLDSIGPAEFIYLIHHARLVVTDSFHSIAFSILFHTPFIVYERNTNEKNMSSRIETLLQTFKLEQCRERAPLTINELRNLDFSFVDDILERKRWEAIQFLKSNLD